MSEVLDIFERGEVLLVRARCAGCQREYVTTAKPARVRKQRFCMACLPQPRRGRGVTDAPPSTLVPINLVAEDRR